MGEIVSLKLHRKRKARDGKDEQAAENRAAFGRKKSERELAEAREAKALKDLESHKREE